MLKPHKRYERYRWFYTTNDILVVGGKSDDQNEEVLEKFLKPKLTVLHTSNPGSPFMILQKENPSKKDIKEAAIFCACFSKTWKSGKKTISIDIFRGQQIYKNKKMKLGTFGVKGKKETIKVTPELVLVMQKGKLRAVPNSTKEKKLIKINQGKLSKEDAAAKISKIIKDKYAFPITTEEILKAIPSDKISIL